MKTILLAAAALAVFTGCQSAVDKQRLEEAASGDLPNCARIRVVSGGCGKNSGLTEVYVDNMHKNQAVQVTVRSIRRKATTTQIMPLPKVASSLSGAEAAEPALLLSAAKC